uniref:DUF38 domain-containing protein n=1 Tax=Panagrolaimus davidi TaxID=227884 RepID=A0A914Q303_9BILA
MGPSIKEFAFDDPVGVDIDMISDALIHEGIEHVRFHKKVPEKSLTKLCQITSIKDLSYSFTFAQLPLIRSKSPRFSFDFDFADFIKEKPENFTMPWVKDLRICSDVELSDFTAESVENFVKCISEIFLNIEKLYIHFVPSNRTWKSGYGILKVLEPHLFQSIPLSVKGEVKMELCLEKMELDEFYKLTEDDNEYVVALLWHEKNLKFTANLLISS